MTERLQRVVPTVRNFADVRRALQQLVLNRDRLEDDFCQKEDYDSDEDGYIDLAAGGTGMDASTGLGLIHVNSGTAALQKMRRTMYWRCISPTADLAAGDDIDSFAIGGQFAGWKIVAVGAHVWTASTSGGITLQFHNVTDAVDILSTELTIDATEDDSVTAATPAVVDTSNNEVAEGDVIRIDVDANGTGAKGLDVRLEVEEA